MCCWQFELAGVGPDAPLETTSRAELMDFDANLPSSFSTAGPKTLLPSVSNFVIPIASPDGSETVAIMYFLDSGGGSMAEFISADQAAWLTTIASKINPDASYGFLPYKCKSRNSVFSKITLTRQHQKGIILHNSSGDLRVV